MTHVQSQRQDFGNGLWRFYFFHDYSPTESVLVLKVHHGLADGIALVMECGNLADVPEVQTFPSVSERFPFCKRLLLFTTVPFSIIYLLVKGMFESRETNGIKNPENEPDFSAEKHLAISKDISLEAVKLRCKELGLTLNEFLFGIISQTMKRCMEHHGDQTTNRVMV